MDTARTRILQIYHLSPDAQIGSGMEAEVYAYGPDTVLKLYDGTTRLADLLTLRAFYDSLDRRRVPYALPRIHNIAQEENFLITIEQRLVGRPMSEYLPTLTPDQLESMMQRYLNAALAFTQIQPPTTFDRYKLFDPDRLSQRADGDWHRFLSRYLAHKLPEVSPYLRRDVTAFEAKLAQLNAILSQPYPGDYRLIHGDFFPGNLLLDETGQVSALLDFGLFTMVGDALFDLATGWVFFDMYDQLKVQARARYLALLIDRLGEGVRGRLYLYVLIYSILSANTYSHDCSDGHYQWCVENLNRQEYWNPLTS